jgi:putative ABC transport system permease protein
MLDGLKPALRSLRATPGFTAVALIVLTLGIGATTAIFSVVDAVVLRALPFDEHDRLVAVGERSLPRPGAAPSTAPPADPAAVSSSAPQNYMDWAAQQQVFEAMAAIAGGALTLQEPGGEPEEIRASRVTAGFFDVLRVRPAMGQPFTSAHETEGNHQVVVLSDGLWRRRFGADPGMVGRSIPLEGARYEVVGVMPPDFAYPIGAVRSSEMWVPYVVPPDERIRNPNSVSIYLSSIARLKPGISLEQAQANLAQIAAGLRQTHPKWNEFTDAGVRPLHDHIVGARTRQWMLMLLGAVGLVLLIACANVANLMLARATAREREMGIRAALGAGRARLIRGLLVESLVLSIAGTLLAVVVAWWGVQVLKSAMPDGVPRVASIAVDLRVLGAAAAIALATGLVFGIVPAIQSSRPDLTHALKEGARGATGGRARQRMRSALVVAEIALSVVLLVGAALFIGSFRTLMKIDPGFNPERVLTASIQPRLERNVSTGNTLPDYSARLQDIVDRIADTPGVAHVAAISGGMPMGGSMSTTSVRVPGRTLQGRDGSISIRRVTPDYHATLQIPLIRGRYLSTADRAEGLKVVVINQLAADRLFPGEEAVGRTVVINGADRAVVGVVGNVYQSSLETEPRTEAYVPMSQNQSIFAELLIRTTGDPYQALSAMKAATLAVLPDVPLRNVRTMEELLSRRIAQRRLNMLLLGLFGVLGLVISAVGIYGVMSYVVAQRTREIGVRMALGAAPSSVLRMVLVRASVLVFGGLALGGLAAWYLSETAQAFLFRMDVTDPRAFAGAIGVLAAAALVASAVPARRAARVDPLVALRAE